MSYHAHFIQLQQVHKTFANPKTGTADYPVLHNVSLELKQGELVCLLGPSGCGKSTILNLIAGFEQPSQGKLTINDRPITGPGPDRAVVFQQPYLFPWLSVLDNVTYGPRMAGRDKQDYLKQAYEQLEQVGLKNVADHFIWQLSGGMKQRVALARAWILKAQVLLMDEPFAALDAQTRLIMQETLTTLWGRHKTTILFVTHDVEEALLLADRILVMSVNPGTIREEIAIHFERPRTIEQLIADPTFIKLKQTILHIIREETQKTIIQ